MLRVLLFQNIIPMYRRAVFEQLAATRDIELTIVAGDQLDTPNIELLAEGNAAFRVKTVRTRYIRLGRLGGYSYQPKAVGLVLDQRPDVIIAGGSPYWLTSWALLLLGRLLRIPVLLWTHGLLRAESGPKWWVRRCFYKLSRGLLLYGDHAKELLANKGFDSDSLTVVYNSLDFLRQNKVRDAMTQADIRTFRTRLNMEPGERLIAFVGRLQPVKRLDLLIEATALLSRSGKPVHVALVGEGSERERLESLAAQLGVTGLVHFLGASYDEQFIGTVFSASDLSVVPSGAGLSVMHALGYGTPVLIDDEIARHPPEWEAVKEDVTGFFYERGNITELAAKIDRAVFPAPRKPGMADACIAVIADRYHPSRHARNLATAVRTIAREATTDGTHSHAT